MPFLPVRNPAPDPSSSPDPFLGHPALWIQIAAVIVIATVVAWFGRFWPVGTWNAVTWIAPPIFIALLCNKGAARLVIALLLASISLATIIGNEAVAHLTLGTCLYDWRCYIKRTQVRSEVLSDLR